MSNPTRVYWDTDTFLNYLEGGHALQDHMAMVIEDWHSGKVTLVTSALTIAEVAWVRETAPNGQRRRVRPDEIDAVERLFSDPTLLVVELHAHLAREARGLVWSHQIRPKDSVHVASALAASCEAMHTFDQGLHEKSGKLGGSPRLEICKPSWTRQLVATQITEPGSYTELVAPTIEGGNLQEP